MAAELAVLLSLVFLAAVRDEVELIGARRSRESVLRHLRDERVSLREHLAALSREEE